MKKYGCFGQYASHVPKLVLVVDGATNDISCDQEVEVLDSRLSLESAEGGVIELVDGRSLPVNLIRHSQWALLETD